MSTATVACLDMFHKVVTYCGYVGVPHFNLACGAWKKVTGISEDGRTYLFAGYVQINSPHPQISVYGWGHYPPNWWQNKPVLKSTIMALVLSLDQEIDLGSTGCQALHGLGCNRTHPFDSGNTGCQALYGLGCNRRQSNSPVWLV